jgi:hypothetical protein
MAQLPLVQITDIKNEKLGREDVMSAEPILAAQRAATILALAQAQREARKAVAEPTHTSTPAPTPTERAGRYL